MLLLIKNKHTAPVSPPPVKGFPLVVFAPGVTPIATEHWRRIADHPSMRPFRKLLEVIRLEADAPDVVIHEEPNVQAQDAEEEADTPPPTPALPPLGGAK